MENLVPSVTYRARFGRCNYSVWFKKATFSIHNETDSGEQSSHGTKLADIHGDP